LALSEITLRLLIQNGVLPRQTVRAELDTAVKLRLQTQEGGHEEKKAVGAALAAIREDL
jgi:hypothetical protein